MAKKVGVVSGGEGGERSGCCAEQFLPVVGLFEFGKRLLNGVEIRAAGRPAEQLRSVDGRLSQMTRSPAWSVGPNDGDRTDYPDGIRFYW